MKEFNPFSCFTDTQGFLGKLHFLSPSKTSAIFLGVITTRFLHSPLTFRHVHDTLKGGTYVLKTTTTTTTIITSCCQCPDLLPPNLHRTCLALPFMCSYFGLFSRAVLHFACLLKSILFVSGCFPNLLRSL